MGAERKILDYSFYARPDVLQISRELLGKVLVSEMDGIRTSGIITETEAYAGIHDKASHAYGNRQTKRTATMFGPPGISYVYLCYGIHHLFNVVTHQEGIPHAVLVRAIEPLEGIEEILRRRKKEKLRKNICGGPGTLSQGLGIKTIHNGLDLSSSPITIEDHGIIVPEKQISVGPRIGVDYAKEDALLPYRFVYSPNA